MANNPGRRSKVTKAAMGRMLAEVQAQEEQRREMPSALARVVDHYTSPGLTAAQLEAIRPFLHAAIVASTLVGVESVRKHCTHLASLAVYALQRGKALDPAVVLTTALIDEYIRLGANGSAFLKAERRRRLLALASTVNPGPNTPARLTPIGHSAIKPCYTPGELAVIIRVCGGQPTKVKGRDLSALVALGAGAGLDSVDLRYLYVEHVEDLEGNGLQVHVPEPRPRIVPVRATLEDLLRRAVAGRRPDELVLGHKPDRRNTAARAVENAALYKVPHIEPARLRATWLADLMTDAVPIGVLLQAAGLRSARTLVDLLPHLGPWLEHKNLPAHAAGVLRGGSQ